MPQISKMSMKAMNAMKSPMKSMKSMKAVKSVKGGNDMFKYVMMILLVVIIFFTIYYVYDINKAVTQQEHFIESEEMMKKKYKVVLIYSTSCSFCDKFKPIFDNVMSTYKQVASIEKHETGTQGSLQYMSLIKGVPFTIILKDGEIVSTKAGLMDEAQLKSWMSEYMV